MPLYINTAQKKPIRKDLSAIFIHSPKITQRPLYGFTLIELLVTLSAVSILLIFAIPSFRTMLLNNRLAANMDLLVKDLNYARVTALNHHSTIQICPLNALNSPICGTNWTNGWIVTTQPTNGTATLLRSQQNNAKGQTIVANVTTIAFSSRGLTANQSNFTLCDSRGHASARSVEVMATGFIQSGPTPGTAVWNNAALTCP